MLNLFFEKEKEEIQEEKKVKNPSHFDVVNQLKKGKEGDPKFFNGFLFLKQYSNNPNLITYINNLNCLKLENDYLYSIAKMVLPKITFYVTFPKNKKEKPNIDIKAIMWFYKINYETAKRYLNEIDKKELKEIKETYKEIS